MIGRLAKVALYVAGALFLSAVSIAVALLVTPPHEVTAAGQSVRVGASAPSLDFTGPGELQLFGRSMPTAVDFVGPVRPKLVLDRITLNRELSALVHKGEGSTTKTLGGALEEGWVNYFSWEIAITGLVALILVGALCGWLRLRTHKTLALVVGGLVFVEAINVGVVMVAAVSAPGVLRHTSSLSALVGRTPLPKVQPASVPDRPGIDAVVMGDSTAAGLGNPPIFGANRMDKACGRSADSFASDLAVANGWEVSNLACSGATIAEGILGPQSVAGFSAPAQLSVAQKATHAKAVFLSIGADDIHWSTIVALCVMAPSCDNNATTAYFQQQLADFSTDYYDLLRQLTRLAARPKVVVNLYYNPFDTSRNCLRSHGLTPSKERTLGGMLDALNGVLADGARASSFYSALPDFSGHALCDKGSYVQGFGDRAPFHPNAAGELAIALADQKALGGQVSSG